MRTVKTFTVLPVLPKKLRRFYDLSYNLLWSWDFRVGDLFKRLDSDLWEETQHNPVLLLRKIDRAAIEAKANDSSYVFQLERVANWFDGYMQKALRYPKRNKFEKDLRVLYFSMEYGITESLPIYSGGLGVLSGDHLKSASELGIPLYGMGLLYQKGSFHQLINEHGMQKEKYENNDFCNMPITPELDKSGKIKVVDIPILSRVVYVKIWKAMVGRIPLYLLDTDISANSNEDRNITGEIYGGNNEMRLLQEIVLGIGGIRAIELLEEDREFICHMNEGHSAFSVLERIKTLVQKHGLKFSEAIEVVKSGSVFTTHTSVKAGIDVFSPELIEKYFSGYCNEVSISLDDLLALGRMNPKDDKEYFSMAVLAIKSSCKTNAVSKLHCEVSRKMWQSLWQEKSKEEIPLVGITNGIHLQSWVSLEMSALFNRYLGPKWSEESTDDSIWNKVFDIPDCELWKTREIQRKRLVDFARSCLKQRYIEQCKPLSEVEEAGKVLNPDALTIGFSRRFTLYKRAYLIFKDLERLKQIITNESYPVQIIIAGKAHPKDDQGKKIIEDILRISGEEPFRQHIVFLQNYNMNVARYLVQGSDIWLNNPYRGMEASGTSGMKAAANGVINFSTLDGWWDEIYKPGIGWAIGKGKEYTDFDYWDEQESNTIYEILEKEIISLFYNRNSMELPGDWISMMKRSIVAVCPFYNTDRMVYEYTEFLYSSAFKQYKLLI